MMDAATLAAVLTGVAGIIGAIYAGLVQLRKLQHAHDLQLEQLRANRYLVDLDELEDLRWWRRSAITVVNSFLDDYATRSLDPPVDVHKALDYPPPTRPRKPKGLLHE
jgi:hypothetical protein